MAALIQVIVTNRIQHVCTPYGRPARISSLERVLLRLPAIVMLSYSLWGLVKAMVQDTSTASAQNWLAYIRPLIPTSAQPAKNESLLWFAFLGACVAQCISTAIRSLELAYVAVLTQDFPRGSLDIQPCRVWVHFVYSRECPRIQAQCSCVPDSHWQGGGVTWNEHFPMPQPPHSVSPVLYHGAERGNVNSLPVYRYVH